MRKLIMMLTVAVVFGATLTGFGETVTNVRGSQRPNSNLVDIYYDLNAMDGGTYTVEVAIEGRTNEVTATTFSGDVGKGIAPGKNHHILWEAGADWRGKKGDVKAIVTAMVEARKGKPKKVQLWEGGPYWADRNIGADNPWDYGLYFWWGDTEGHRLLSDGTFGFSFEASNCPTCGKDIAMLHDEEWIIANGVLAPSHDAAHVKWGGSWRMPTNQEFDDLYSKCDWIWTTVNGVNGYVVHGRDAYASKSIFLPAAGLGERASLKHASFQGRYFASNPYGGNQNLYAHHLRFDSNNIFTLHFAADRCDGLPIRPVQKSAK